jgi:hypothetical protein
MLAAASRSRTRFSSKVESRRASLRIRSQLVGAIPEPRATIHLLEMSRRSFLPDLVALAGPEVPEVLAHPWHRAHRERLARPLLLEGPLVRWARPVRRDRELHRYLGGLAVPPCR